MKTSVHTAAPGSIPKRSSASASSPWGKLRAFAAHELSLPGAGDTLRRWQTFSAIAEEDLALAKVYESHADALAILAEFHEDAAPGLWAVFAAEPPHKVLHARGEPPRLDGEKAWCSAAAYINHALVTCVDEYGARRLAQVRFSESGIGIEPTPWAAAGMAETETVDLVFSAVPCRYVGGERAYLDRPGFWQGAIGVAACWHGAAAGLARALRLRCREHADPHALVHLGAIDASLRASRCALSEAARFIDAHPSRDARSLALATRATVERSVEEVLGRCGRALGAGPLCRDGDYAKRVQDLMVFVRQSHAERDLADLGECCARDEEEWSL